jgi:hypothetical protein
LGVKELSIVTQYVVACLKKRSFDATPYTLRRNRLIDGESASSVRLNKHSLINPLQEISDETPYRLAGYRFCLTLKISRMISESHPPRCCLGFAIMYTACQKRLVMLSSTCRLGENLALV